MTRAARIYHCLLWALLPIAVGVTFLCYGRGLPGAFVFDDRPGISHNSALKIDSLDLDSLREAAFSSDSGPLKRPLSMVTFALNYYFTALNPLYFKATNIVIHLLTGVSLAFLTSTLLSAPAFSSIKPTRRHGIAIATASAWLLHPFLLTSVLYTVQRMTSLSGLFTVLGAVIYSRARLFQLRNGKGTVMILASFLIFTPLAALCKENGLLLPLLLFSIEICVFRFAAFSTKQKRQLTGLFCVTAALPVIGGLLYLAHNSSSWFGGYQMRDFSLIERLLTQCRVVAWYLQMIVLPDIQQMGLHHDDFDKSTGLLSPLATFPSIALMLILWTAIVITWKKQPVLSFGLLWFFVGHLLESTIFPLELVYEHRNYLPAYGIIFILFYYLLNSPITRKKPQLSVLASATYFLFLAFSLQLRAQTWSSEVSLVFDSAKNHPNSARAHYDLAILYMRIAENNNNTGGSEFLHSAEAHFLQSLRIKPDMVASMVSLIHLRGRYGQQIPTSLIDNITTGLQKYPISASSTNALWLLTDCSVRGRCNIAPPTYLTITVSALSNKHVTADQKAIILKYISIYFGRGLKDFETAAYYADLAIGEQPSYIDVRYNRIEWLTHLHDFEAALTEIEKIRTLDKYGKEAKKLKELQHTIAGLAVLGKRP